MVFYYSKCGNTWYGSLAMMLKYGIVVKQGKDHTRCYPYKDSKEAPTKRSCHSFIQDAIKANEEKVMVNISQAYKLSLCSYKEIYVSYTCVILA